MRRYQYSRLLMGVILLGLSLSLLKAQGKRAFVGINQNTIDNISSNNGELNLGVGAGFAVMYNDDPVIRWFQTYRLGLHSLGSGQITLPIYTELGFRIIAGKTGFAIGPQVGLGYAHLFLREGFGRVNEDGTTFIPNTLGYSQWMIPLTLGASYGTGPVRYYINFQKTFQGALPYSASSNVLEFSSWRFGVSFPFMKKTPKDSQK